MKNILLVEDEKNLHETIKLNLELEGYIVTSAFTGKEAMKILHQANFDLLILDWMLPEIDGITLLEHVRLHIGEVPILILSANDTDAHRIEGLQKGADDYLRKPFHLTELLLRINKIIKVNTKIKDIHAKELTSYYFEGNTINFEKQEAISFKGEVIELSKKELLLLKLLIDHKDQVVSRQKILQLIWGYQIYPTTRTIDNFILNFRKYFEKKPNKPIHFQSVWGIGYKFSEK